MKRLFALLMVLAACATPRLPPREPKEAAEPPATEVRRVYYPGGKQLKKRYVVLVDPSGGAEKHGREEEWHADGERKAERTFEHGAPSGTWRTWYDGGAVESVVEIGDGTELLPMRWWYADGTPPLPCPSARARARGPTTTPTASCPSAAPSPAAGARASG